MGQIVSFYRDSSSTAWKINGNPTPNGVYRALYAGTGASMTVMVVHPEYGNRALFPRTLITEIQKEDGTTYANFTEFDDAVGPFFVKASGTGTGTGAGRISYVPDDSPFATNTARDTWATGALNELFNNETTVTVVTVNDGTTINVYEWGGTNTPTTAPSNIGNFWILRTSMSAGDRTILDGISALTEQIIPKKQGNTLVDSAMIEEATQIRSTKGFRAPFGMFNTGTLMLDNALDVRTNSKCLEVIDNARNKTREVLIHDYDATGNSAPVYCDLEAMSVTMVQPLSDENSGSFSFTVPIAQNSNRAGVKFQQVVVIPHAAGVGNFTVQYQNSSGATLVTDTQITFETSNIGNQVTINLSNPIDLFNGESAYVTYSGVAVRGHTYTSDPTFGTGFFPFINAMSQNFTEVEIGRAQQESVELTANLTINSSNLNDYNRKLIYTPLAQTGEITITIAENTNIDFFDLSVLGTGAVLVRASGSERVNGETDIRFTNLEGGRIKKLIDGQYTLIFDNTDPDMVDDHVNSVDLSLSGQNLTCTLGFTGTSLPDISDTIALPSSTAASLFSGVSTLESQTGNFVITNVTNTLYNTGTQITGLSISDASLENDLVYAIHNQLSTDLAITLTGTGVQYGGRGSGTSFTIPTGQTVLFYVRFNTVYPALNFNTASGGGATGDHPVVLTRDTPSLSDLNDLANASLNDNSALWVIASNQIQATENNVDASIMIRALSSGLMDADGNTISTTTPVQKRNVRLAGGSIVRIFSSTDLRVVSTPVSVPTQVPTYPDIAFTGAVRLEESDESLYNTYLGRTATNAGGSNQYIAMPSLDPTERPAWVREGDVFVMRHTGTTTGTQRPHFRPDNTGDAIAGHGLQYHANPGETIAIQAPRVGIRSWQLFPVAQRSDGVSYYAPEMATVMADWYRDEVDSTAVDNSVRLHYRQEIVQGNVRDHVETQSSANNPVSLTFESRNLQDDIAWINWFTTLGFAVPAIGTGVEEIKNNVPTSLLWIQNNITDSSDFQVNDPLLSDSIQYVTHQVNQTIKVGLSVALPAHFSVNDVIHISGNSFAGNNGDWAITQIYSDRLAIDINIPSSSSANNTGASGTISRILYGRNTLVADDLRVHTFNLYKNNARNNPVTNFHTEWFDIATDPAPTGSILDIAYNTDVQTTGSEMAVQDDAGDFFAVKGGPRETSVLVNNRTTPVTTGTALPVNARSIFIDSSVGNTFYLPEFPSQLNEGEARYYDIYSTPTTSVGNAKVAVGDNGTIILDEGLRELTALDHDSLGIMLYNNGTTNGARLYKHIHRRIQSNTVYPNLTALPGISFLLPFTSANVNTGKNEDPHGQIFDLSTDNRVTVKAKGRYTFHTSIRVSFVGTEPSGLMFATPVLTPYTTGNNRLDQYAFSVPLFLARNGTSGSTPFITLQANFDFDADVDDWFEFEIQTVIPTGYTVSDFRVQSFTFSITADIGG